MNHTSSAPDIRTSGQVKECEQVETSIAYQRDLFDTLLRTSPDAIYFKDLDSRFIHYSKSFSQLFHLSDVETLKGKTDADFFTPEHAQAARDDERRVIDTGKPLLGKVEKETHIDGRVTWALTSKLPWHDKTGNIIGTVGISKDITAHRQAEEALRQSDERFQSAFQYAAIGMALVGPNGRFLKVNQSLCELTGYAETELLASTFQEITHPDDLGTDLKYVRQMLVGEIRTYQMEKRYFHKLGHIVWVLLSVSLVRNGAGEPVHFISQIQDITERKQSLAQREQLIQELQSALSNVKLLSGLLPICAHCKKVRDDKGYWNQIEIYIRDHSEACFTHGICPECTKKLYPELSAELQ